MRAQGWYEKPGVKILEGKWQDFVEGDELLSVGGFDVVYTDTFSEDYSGTLPAPYLLEGHSRDGYSTSPLL